MRSFVHAQFLRLHLFDTYATLLSAADANTNPANKETAERAMQMMIQELETDQAYREVLIKHMRRNLNPAVDKDAKHQLLDDSIAIGLGVTTEDVARSVENGTEPIQEFHSRIGLAGTSGRGMVSQAGNAPPPLSSPPFPGSRLYPWPGGIEVMVLINGMMRLLR